VTAIDLVLASQSPRRRELLQQIGVRFAVHSADVAEIHGVGESAQEYVLRLARCKAETIAALRNDGVPVLGADTIGVCNGEILEKPADLDAAKRMLLAMSDTWHQVISGVALTDGSRLRTAVSVTEVHFRSLSEGEIESYWATGEPQDKSGSYGIQGFGAVFVESIRGSYSNVVGLPIESLVPLFSEFAIPVWVG